MITIDLALDEGNPEEQLKFLRLHDAKTKRLYFLWHESTTNMADPSPSKHVCGCVGGCYYYSVFPDKATTKAAGFDFFDLGKSISRTSADFGKSLFQPGKHVLKSQPIMENRYDPLLYSYNSILARCFTEPPPMSTMRPPATVTNPSPPMPDPADIRLVIEPDETEEESEVNRSHTFSNATRISISTASLRSSVATTNNEDDYYTADEDEEEENQSEEVTLNESSTLQRQTTLNGAANMNNNHHHHQRNFESENKMDLNFDIKRPILDSSLPKYCYLKYLSRAQVTNWNRTYLYPCYEDSTQKNINFGYRQHGINFFNLVSTSYSPKWNNQTIIGMEHEDILDSTESEKNSRDCKCRINLKFSVFECYITPLLLTGLGRFIESLSQYKISPNSLITQLQTKAHAHSAANSFKGI